MQSVSACCTAPRPSPNAPRPAVVAARPGAENAFGFQPCPNGRTGKRPSRAPSAENATGRPVSAVPPLAALRVPPVTCPAQQWAGATRRDRRRCNPPPNPPARRVPRKPTSGPVYRRSPSGLVGQSRGAPSMGAASGRPCGGLSTEPTGVPPPRGAPGLSVSERARSVPTPTFFDALRQLRSGLARSCRKTAARPTPGSFEPPWRRPLGGTTQRRRGPFASPPPPDGLCGPLASGQTHYRASGDHPDGDGEAPLGALAAAAGASALGRQVSQRPSPPRTEDGKRATARPKRPW